MPEISSTAPYKVVKGSVSVTATHEFLEQVHGARDYIEQRLLANTEREVRKAHPEAASVAIEIVPWPDAWIYGPEEKLQIEADGDNRRTEYTMWFIARYTEKE
jgi:hypothetical protein